MTEVKKECEHPSITPGGRIYICRAKPHPRNPDNHYYVLDEPDPNSDYRPGEPMENRELEASLEQFFRKRVKLAGGHTIKLAPLEAGTPDRLAMFPGGHMFLVELKTETGQVSPIQAHWHKRMDDLGIEVHVLYGRNQIVEWIRQIWSALDAENEKAD